MSRLYDVTKEEVDQAWKMVRQAGGGAGYDGKRIEDLKVDEVNQLYKIWNRLSSGSYIPSPVLLVDIPKAKGGYRQLGIPTVTDRIAQTVIKNRLESVLQPLFHEDSYAYQAGKGAIEALTKARQRCIRMDWVIELDIKAFFDEIDHDLLMTMVKKYVTDKATLLYVSKFIKAPGRKENEEVKIVREKGTPQGGVISPVLANLYLHEVFDQWMQEEFKDVSWERYADDIIVHCVSEKQAYFLRNRIEGRLRKFKLSLHPEKTRVVYTGTKNDHDSRGHKLSRKFTFLGYDFKPRGYKGQTVFTPGIGSGALKRISQKIKKEWNLRRRTSSLEEIAGETNAVIRGWINYYGHHRRSDLYKMAEMIDKFLVGFIKRKQKTASSWAKGWKYLKERRRKQPNLFCHWYMISLSKRGAV